MRTEILPDFIIIGAMKAGTTTLYDYLCCHEQVGMSREKETDYFLSGGSPEKSLEWYHSQFRPGRKIYGEASPNYTKMQAFPGVPDRVAALIPDCKLIFISRDPIKRIESQYRHAILSGVDLPPQEKLIGTKQMQHLIETSAYAAQMDHWLLVFPREKILFLKLEAMIADPIPVLTELAAFLEISNNWPKLDIAAANSSESLARLPKWLFIARRVKVLSWLKDVTSARFRRNLKLFLQSRTSRATPVLSAQILEHSRLELAEDWKRFKQMSEVGYERSGE